MNKPYRCPRVHTSIPLRRAAGGTCRSVLDSHALLSIVPPRPVRVAHAAAAPIQARGLSAPKLSNNILQKELAFIGHWSGTVVESGRYKRPGILPRRLAGRGGVSVVRRNGAINRMEDSDAKVCKEAFA